MGKRYKKGNVGRGKKGTGKIYINREKEINRKINQFRKTFYTNNMNNIEVYYELNRLRLDIKQLFSIQSTYVHRQSRKRRNIYYKQLSEFKGLYVTWKKVTLPVYLSLRFHVPEPILTGVAWFYRETMKHKKPPTNYNIIKNGGL